MKNEAKRCEKKKRSEKRCNIEQKTKQRFKRGANED
jgi:hypothetical protein